MLRVATDIGGTFTDLVYVTPDGEVGTAKSHSTPGQFEKGVMDVIEASHISPKEFVSFVHGTTVVINAITERKGAKVGLLTTEGFRDILEIGRGNRPDFLTWNTASQNRSCRVIYDARYQKELRIREQKASRSISPGWRRSYLIFGKKEWKLLPSAFSTPTPTQPTKRLRW